MTDTDLHHLLDALSGSVVMASNKYSRYAATEVVEDVPSMSEPTLVSSRTYSFNLSFFVWYVHQATYILRTVQNA